jgi:uncharacterized membrane protein YdjX (TVP38/TMEM64 family)
VSLTLSRNVRRALLGVLVAAFLAGAVYLWRTGGVTAGGIRDWLDSLGPAAPALFVGAFVLGSFVGLPGLVFVVGARLAFGPWLGFALGYGGGMCAVTVPFVTARWLRRQPETPWRPKNRHAAKVFDQLATHPLRAVIVLRLILWFNPPLSYALALTQVRLRDYLLGCALALAPVVAMLVTASGWFM